jgi:two-component system, NarL family, response regulator NreC
MSRTRLLIADDHGIMREGLRMLLASQPDMDVVGEAVDGIDAMEQARRLQPEVIVLDIAMPRMNGLDAISLLKNCAPNSKIVILSAYEKEAFFHEALKAGAHAYVIKGAPSRELLVAIRAATAGKIHLSDSVQNEVIRNYLENYQQKPVVPGYDALSEREQQVFRLLIEGNSCPQIADLLCISSKTVDKHRAAIVRKTGLDNPAKMIHYAIRTGLIDAELWQE